ncbi:hypothetical protein [Paractinoplanes durhamensis]|uniref:hypothetical protein n=1 Tax=Paractinoplanes durhamensis TaxID=113563 RepID=UPI0019453F92|nr:hypothetical protein [Actinoplanes durhamensis]
MAGPASRAGLRAGQVVSIFKRVLGYLLAANAHLIGMAVSRVRRDRAEVGRAAPPALDRARAWEAGVIEATTRLVGQAEDELAGNTADAWLDRMSMPQAVFDALDAYLAAFGDPMTPDAAVEHRSRRRAWLWLAMDNWHRSPDYSDDAGCPMPSLRAGRLATHRRVRDALADPTLGEGVARDLLASSRLEWLMAVGRRAEDPPNSYNLPPSWVQAALDAYFAAKSDVELDDPDIPLYPDLHLVSETVVRAAMADYCPECPHNLHWSEGLPAPVRAALDALG